MKIGKVATCVFQDGGFTKVIYHSTPVVMFRQGEIILDSGGWQTVTTKKRMNEVSRSFNLGFEVLQQDYSWYVLYEGKKIDFFDGMKLKAKEEEENVKD